MANRFLAKMNGRTLIDKGISLTWPLAETARVVCVFCFWFFEIELTANFRTAQI